MNKYKQIEEIEEMADEIRRVRESYFGQADYLFAMKMYEDGYRKASDVAREIFEEIEKFNRTPLPECEPVYIIKASELAELKKKYTEGEDNDT